MVRGRRFTFNSGLRRSKQSWPTKATANRRARAIGLCRRWRRQSAGERSAKCDDSHYTPQPDKSRPAVHIELFFRLAVRGSSCRNPKRQAKPPVPPRMIGTLQTWWDRHSACRDFCYGLACSILETLAGATHDKLRPSGKNSDDPRKKVRTNLVTVDLVEHFVPSTSVEIMGDIGDSRCAISF